MWPVVLGRAHLNKNVSPVTTDRENSILGFYPRRNLRTARSGILVYLINDTP